MSKSPALRSSRSASDVILDPVVHVIRRNMDCQLQLWPQVERRLALYVVSNALLFPLVTQPLPLKLQSPAVSTARAQLPARADPQKNLLS